MVHRVWVREIQLLEDAKPCKFPDEKLQQTLPICSERFAIIIQVYSRNVFL